MSSQRSWIVPLFTNKGKEKETTTKETRMTTSIKSMIKMLPYKIVTSRYIIKNYYIL